MRRSMPKLVAEPEVSSLYRIWTLPSVWMFYNQNLSHSSHLATLRQKDTLSLPVSKPAAT